jgi:hypothetical protein
LNLPFFETMTNVSAGVADVNAWFVTLSCELEEMV